MIGCHALRLAVLASIPLCAGVASATNLVVDPSFEAGGVGWTFNATDANVGIGGLANTGTQGAYATLLGGGNGSVTQDIATFVDHDYLIEFYIADNSFQAGSIYASFGGVVGYTENRLLDFVQHPYALHSFHHVATGAISTFAFGGDVISSGTFFIDDVSVTDLGRVVDVDPIPTPEPVTLALLVTALGGLRVMRQRSATA